MLIFQEYKGDLILQGTKSDIQKNISTNNPILFKFEFPRQDDLPRIIEIRLNNRMICFGEDGKCYKTHYVYHEYILI